MSDEGVARVSGQPLVRTQGGDTVALIVDLTIYAMPAVLRASYRFSERCFFFLRREAPGTVTVHVQNRSPGETVDRWIGDFANELLDQQLREHLAQEAGPLRELIAAQAFAEGNLLDEDRDEGDYGADPANIARTR